jgi:hypothetical protein
MSLCDVVKGNRSLQMTLAATEQFQQFLLEPANAMTTIGPIVIVIDAMDESDDECLTELSLTYCPGEPLNFCPTSEFSSLHVLSGTCLTLSMAMDMCSANTWTVLIKGQMKLTLP